MIVNHSGTHSNRKWSRCRSRRWKIWWVLWLHLLQYIRISLIFSWCLAVFRIFYSKLLLHRTCFYSPFRPFEQGPFLRASNAERSYKETLDYYCNDAKTRRCKLALSKMQLLINVLKRLSIMLPIRNFLYRLKVIMIYKTVSL